MPEGVVVKPIAAVRVAELTGTAASYEPQAITPVIQPLYCELFTRPCKAGVAAAGSGLAYYEDAPGADGAIEVHAAVPVATSVGADHSSGGELRADGSDFDVVDLPAIKTAATLIHNGSMDDVLPSGQALARWIDANGYRPVGYMRELTINWAGDRQQWVTELQQSVA